MAQKQTKPAIELIVIGGSSGSLKAIIKIFSLLHPDFAIPIIIIQHRAKNAGSSLQNLLSLKTILKVKEADEKEFITPGNVYLAPPDYHLLIEKDRSLSLDDTEKVRYSRPSIDVSFESAAQVYGNKLLAIVLSGANADGALGAEAVKHAGGRVWIQDPADAVVAYMPQYAITQTKATQVYTPVKMASCLNNLHHNSLI